MALTSADQKANTNEATAQNKNIDKRDENTDSLKLGEAQKAETPQSEEQTDMHVAEKKNEASTSQKSGSFEKTSNEKSD